MALNLDNARTEPDELMLSLVLMVYLDNIGKMWQSTPNIRRPMLTSACLCSRTSQNFLSYVIVLTVSLSSIDTQWCCVCIITLSRGRSLPALARPPQRSDEPRTRSK